jgi:FtsZ-binding cell division protein ZapB
MQPMNINITNSKETSETDDYSEFEKYIIKNNVQLTKENKELRLQIADLEKQNSEHESENDKYDERIRYMRGLMQNLYSLKEMSISVKNNWEEYVKKSNKLFLKYNQIDENNGLINKIIAIYIVNLIIILLIDILFNDNYIILIKMIIYNSATIGLFSTSYKKYIINDNLYKVYWCQNSKKIIIKYNEEYYNLKKLQDDLENQTKEKMKEINELEKACVGVSVMIDNV